jgi:hypothetical protein
MNLTIDPIMKFTTSILSLCVPIALLAQASAAIVSITATGANSTDATLTGAVANFRTAISAGGGNNGVAGGPFSTGRREINWDAAGLDASAVPNSMPANFFNNNSKRGALFTAGSGGSLLVSGRIGASSDLRFDSLNASYSSAFQTFSADRLFGPSGTNTVTTTFFVPNDPTVAGTISSFGAIFTDVDSVGSQIDAFDINGAFLGGVLVPVLNNGLSFAGLHFDNGERIASIRITAGGGGLDQGSNPNLDMVAMDDFFYSEPLAIPEPTTLGVCLVSALGLIMRKSRRTNSGK